MGRVSRQVTEARRKRLRELLADRTYLPLAEVCAELGVSEATARRDLASLEDKKLIRRTHGGALGAYAGALKDFEAYFPTFDQRRQVGAAAKAAIADAVCDLLRRELEPRAGSAIPPTVFIDSGSTCFAVAEEIDRRGVWGPTGLLGLPSGRDLPTTDRTPATSTTNGAGHASDDPGPGAGGAVGLVILTHNIAVAVRLARVEGVEVQVIGGTLLPRQAGMFGDEACKAVAGGGSGGASGGRRIDLAVLGCEGIDGKGASNSQKDVVRLQRVVMSHALRRVFAVDAMKVGVRAPVPLAEWSVVDVLVTDATRAELTGARIELPIDRVVQVKVADK